MALSKREIGSGKWKKLRITILDRDGWQCALCNRPAHTVDHIVPRVKGGDMWSPDNLQAMCKSCNSRKKDSVFLRLQTVQKSTTKNESQIVFFNNRVTLPFCQNYTLVQLSALAKS